MILFFQYIGYGLFQLALFLFIHFQLFVHVEHGKIIIHHLDCGDIIKMYTVLNGKLVPAFYHIAIVVPESNDREQIGGFQGNFLNKLLHY